MIVRSVHLAFDVPDHSGTQASVYYPADPATLEDARLTGLFAADDSRAPWPIVVVMPGINVAPDGYRWLARDLAADGYCVVTYSTIGSLGPAGSGITPGMDMAAFAPDVMGSQCSAAAIGPLLAALRSFDAASPLAGRLDFERVALIGHSAGGAVALHNTNTDWIPGLAAVVTYGAHTMTATALGHEEAAVVAIPAQVPVMMLAGATDSVIAASRDRYRSDDRDHDPIGRTFDEAIMRNHDDCWLVELRHANHFSICDPVDETSGRTFLETELNEDDRATRALIGEVIAAFLEGTVRHGGFDRLLTLLADPSVSNVATR